ncbi:OLC1v1019920C1 [Oldenlandia corymbosa var. corymbosa]|uniref:Calcium-transporting ATPase n=1 Tax=Oldenlandia corymbosa var. corymbosa TaxID=529605 RepID=A0AAV1EF92_OLDCO|nr:OLC1v1019920C1 [Oldenlandia corymbosa var. corymbosa]
MSAETMSDILEASMDPVKRWQRTRLLIYSAMAFYPKTAENEVIKNQEEELLDNLLQQPTVPETVLQVEPDCLFNLVRDRDVELLHQLGGVNGVASMLGSDANKGVPGDNGDIDRRIQNYGSNRLHQQPPKLWRVLIATARDPVVILVTFCGVLALGFGLKHHGRKGLSDGISICVAAFLVITLTAIGNLWPKRQLFKLSKARDDFNILVRRNSHLLNIPASKAVVGDFVVLNTGDQVPADGLFIDGSPLQVDESNVRANMNSVEVDGNHNPFLLSGTKVINGSACMLITAVGKNTAWGELLSSESYHSDRITPLQKRLHELSKLITIIGLVVSSVVLLVLLVRYFIGNLHDDRGKSHFVAGKTRFWKVCGDVTGILATPVAIASTAIPEGLLLAVLISIAFSAKRITAQKAQVRNLSAYEAIGTTTVVITDEKCKLTLDHLAVTSFRFCDYRIVEYPSSVIPQIVLELLYQAIFLSHSEASSSGSLDGQIRTAIQNWGAQDLGLDLEQVRENYTIDPSDLTYNSENTGSWIKNKVDNSLHVHQNGEAETILGISSHYYDKNGDIKPIPNSFRENMVNTVQEMKSKGLCCIAFAHKGISENSDEKDGILVPEIKEECTVFIGVASLKFSCRPEVKKAIQDCKQAGLDIKIITRNDVLTAKAMAIECGFLEAARDIYAGEVVDGLEFQNYPDDEKLEKCQRIRVMARASTLDKLCMVQCLKRKGEVVAVTGDTTGDSIVLKEADVGLSMGTQGTQQAKANSDVVVMDDNFESLARVLTWGRAMYHKIQLYAQFQLTVSISSLVIDFVSTVSAKEPPTFNMVTAISSGNVPYATVQVLWVKLIVGILAAVAITVEEPAELKLLPKVKRHQPFITIDMWKNIVGQAAYPIVVLLTIQFQGQSAFKLDSKAKDTMIFNIFVLWQLCLMLNTKGIDRNIFEGMRRRKWLGVIIGPIILVQILIVELLHKFADTKPLTWQQWMVCIGIAVLTWPIGWIIKKIKCSSEAFFQQFE